MAKQDKQFQETKRSGSRTEEYNLNRKEESLKYRDKERLREKSFKSQPHTKEKFGSMNRDHSKITKS